MSAYLRALEEASRLPEVILGLHTYFGDNYNPRGEAIRHIVNKARLDIDRLLFVFQTLLRGWLTIIR